jgi:hypothetical protein
LTANKDIIADVLMTEDPWRAVDAMDNKGDYIDLILSNALTISDSYESFDAATSADWENGTPAALVTLTMEIASSPDPNCDA